MNNLCEICGKKDKLSVLIIPGAPKVCQSCETAYRRAVKGEIPLNDVITSYTPADLAMQLKEPLTESQNQNEGENVVDVINGKKNSNHKSAGSGIGTAIKVLSSIVMVFAIIG